MSEIRIAIPDLDLNNALRLDGNLRNYEPFFFKKYLWKIAAYSIWFAKIMPNLST